MDEQNLFLAISIGFNEVKAALWNTTLVQEKSSGSVTDLSSSFKTVEKGQVLSRGEAEFYQDKGDLLEAVRNSFHTAQSLAPNQFLGKGKVEGVIFSVPQFWLEESMRSKKLLLLRRLSQDLNVKPLGFVSEVEVLLSFLRKEEGRLLNLVVLSVGDEKINVVPVSQGKILGSQLVERSNNIALDLEEGLSRFEKEDYFAPRILLLGRGNLEEAKQTILSYPWLEPGKSLFLHLPKLEIFPYQLIMDTLVAEMGKEVAVEGEKIDQGEEKKKDLPQGNLGFLKGEDVAQLKKVAKEKEAPEVREGKKVEETEEKGEEELGRKEDNANIFHRKRKINFSFLRHRFAFLLFFLITFFLLGGLTAVWWYLPRAKITLLVQPRFSQKEFSLAVSSKITTVNLEDKVIPGKLLEMEVSGEKVIPTTGKKNVGDKATGEVTIYNGTDLTKTFQQGTVLHGPSEMNFLTQSEVTVASRSGSVVEGWTSGKQKVAVKAEKIGTDYNLGGNTEFKVDLFSKNDFLAKNNEDFKGGSSREVSVVDKDDQKNISQALEQELTDQERGKLSQKLTGGEKIIEESIKVVNKEAKFDHQVDEQADKLSLSLKLTINALAYKESDLDNLVDKVLADQVPEGFRLGKEKDLKFKFLKNNKDQALFNIDAKVSLYPQIDQEGIKRKILGKKISFAKSYLLSLPSIDDFEIQIIPTLPKSLLTIPHRLKNIKIEMEQVTKVNDK